MAKSNPDHVADAVMNILFALEHEDRDELAKALVVGAQMADMWEPLKNAVQNAINSSS